MNGIESKLYMFDHGHGGAAVYVLDMSDTSRPLAHYSRMIPDDCESVGTTSDGYEVFMTEASDGFFKKEKHSIFICVEDLFKSCVWWIYLIDLLFVRDFKPTSSDLKP